MAAMPTHTMTARRAAGGSLRPTRAPIRPPRVDPSAISPAAVHETWLRMMNSVAATPLTSPARMFLTPLSRCSESVKAIPIRAISSTPCAAPK